MNKIKSLNINIIAWIRSPFWGDTLLDPSNCSLQYESRYLQICLYANVFIAFYCCSLDAKVEFETSKE